MSRIMPSKNKDSTDASQKACRKALEIGSAAPAWERWRLAGVFRGEAFPHALAAGTAALSGCQPASGGSLIICQRHNSKMNRSLKFYCAGGVAALLMATSFCGCVTKAQARAQAQAAYLAGQNDALAKMAGAGQGQVIVIVGPVEHPNVPWVEGLTLSQAIATANYTSRHNPKAITITRQGEQASVNPKVLLNGQVVPLEPGDTITIRE
jgi:hypothetical protein